MKQSDSLTIISGCDNLFSMTNVKICPIFFSIFVETNYLLVFVVKFPKFVCFWPMDTFVGFLHFLTGEITFVTSCLR